MFQYVSYPPVAMTRGYSCVEGPNRSNTVKDRSMRVHRPLLGSPTRRVPISLC